MKENDYEKKAKELWGDTSAFREYEEKPKTALVRKAAGSAMSW